MGRADPFVTALEPHAIRGLRVANVSEGLFSGLAAVRQFYSGGNGRVAIDTDGRTFSVGHGISSDAAGRTVERIRELVPQLSGLGAEPVGPRRRVAGHAATFMTMTMLLFALNGPFRDSGRRSRYLLLQRGRRASTTHRCVRDASSRQGVARPNRRFSGRSRAGDRRALQDGVSRRDRRRARDRLARRCLYSPTAADEFGGDAHAPRRDVCLSRPAGDRDCAHDPRHVQSGGELALRVQLSPRQSPGGGLPGADGSGMHGPVSRG